SDPLAMQAITMIKENILNSYNGDGKARDNMHIAQCLAGMAFSNALLGIAHSLAHKTGAVFDVPHGCCNAILLPSVIQYNSKAVMDRYADVARIMGLQGNTDKQLVNALVDAIRELNAKLGIKQSYKENGVAEEIFKENADAIAANAVLDPCTGSNPRPIDNETMKKVLACAYYGEDVAF
ncbi:MAG: iron-containing alcohol dehydrogenase, partial [Oscillospiraceae bacterium]